MSQDAFPDSPKGDHVAQHLFIGFLVDRESASFSWNNSAESVYNSLGGMAIPERRQGSGARFRGNRFARGHYDFFGICTNEHIGALSDGDGSLRVLPEG